MQTERQRRPRSWPSVLLNGGPCQKLTHAAQQGRVWAAIIYSITSSASTTSMGGTSIRSAFPVLGLITSSYLSRWRDNFWHLAVGTMDFAVPWGTASLFPREQHEPVDCSILLTIRRTDAVVASCRIRQGEVS